jgi:hypothetical protein
MSTSDNNNNDSDEIFDVESMISVFDKYLNDKELSSEHEITMLKTCRNIFGFIQYARTADDIRYIGKHIQLCEIVKNYIQKKENIDLDGILNEIIETQHTKLMILREEYKIDFGRVDQPCFEVEDLTSTQYEFIKKDSVMEDIDNMLTQTNNKSSNNNGNQEVLQEKTKPFSSTYFQSILRSYKKVLDDLSTAKTYDDAVFALLNAHIALSRYSYRKSNEYPHENLAAKDLYERRLIDKFKVKIIDLKEKGEDTNNKIIRSLSFYPNTYELITDFVFHEWKFVIFYLTSRGNT